MTQTPPFFAIVIPMYNTERYVSECILSVKKQTFRDFIAVLVDDGSTDGTRAVVQTLIADDPRFVLLQQSNQGVSSARNAALSYLTRIKPQYLAYIDSDDIVLSQWLEKIHTHLVKKFADLVIYGVQEFDQDGVVLVTSNFKTAQEGGRKFLLDCYFGKNGFDKDSMLAHQMLCNKVYRYDCVSDCQFSEKYSLGEDQKYFLDVLNRLRNVLVIPEVFYQYRIRRASLSRQDDVRNFDVLDIYMDALASCVDLSVKSYIFDEALAHLRKRMQQAVDGHYFAQSFETQFYRRIIALKKASVDIKLSFKDRKRFWLLSLNQKIAFYYLSYRRKKSKPQQIFSSRTPFG